MNFYEVLGVDGDADREEIRAAYRSLTREYHPDVNDDARASGQFSVLTRAEDVLTDPGERDDYDSLGHEDYVSDRYPGGLPDVEFDHVKGGPSRATSSSPSDPPGQGTAGSGHDERSAPGSHPRGRDTAGAEPMGGGGGGGGGDGDGGREDGRGAGGDGGDASSGSDQGGAAAASTTGPAGDSTGGSEQSSATARYPSTGGDAGTGTEKSTVGDVLGALVEHVAVSARWLAVVAAAAVYGAGVPAYLRAGDEGVGRLLAALFAADPVAIVGAASEAGYDLPGVVAFTRETGVRAGVVPTDAALLLAGAVLLPVATTAAVVGLRRRSTYRPSRLYALGTFGPAAVVLLDGGAVLGWASVPTLPMLAELALLLALPALSVLLFLPRRLLLAAPVRRRDGSQR